LYRCLLYCPRAHPHLPSFPTRRSSDLIAKRQAEQRDDKEADEQQVAERGQPLLQPVLRAMARRAEPTDFTQVRSIAHQNVPTRRSEEHTSELQSRENLVCRLLLEKKKQ